MDYIFVLLIGTAFCLLTILVVLLLIKWAVVRLRKAAEAEVYFLTYLIPMLEEFRGVFPPEKLDMIEIAIRELKDRKDTVTDLNRGIFKLRKKK